MAWGLGLLPRMDFKALRKVMDHDPDTGISHIFDIQPDGTATVTVEQDFGETIELNKQEYNHAGNDRFGEWNKVASIPLSIYTDMVKSGMVHDQAALKRWLNDSENRFFRTRPGVI